MYYRTRANSNLYVTNTLDAYACFTVARLGTMYVRVPIQVLYIIEYKHSAYQFYFHLLSPFLYQFCWKIFIHHCSGCCMIDEDAIPTTTTSHRIDVRKLDTKIHAHTHTFKAEYNGSKYNIYQRRHNMYDAFSKIIRKSRKKSAS